MEFTGERFMPELTDFNISYEHWHRYLYAGNFIKNKTVLDIACGEGYGSYLLSKQAKKVIGVDIDSATLKYAIDNYKAKNLTFIQGSAAEIPIKENQQFDVIVSFETIEHISEADQVKFLAEVKRLLKPDGLFFASTPNKLVYSDIPKYKNEFHLKEFYRDEFEEFLGQSFKNTLIVGQQIYNVSYISNQKAKVKKLTEHQLKLTGDGFQPSKDIREDTYMLAICSNAKFPEPPSSISFDPSFDPSKHEFIKQKLFLNTGNGFNEKERIIHTNSIDFENKIKISFDIPSFNQIKELRFHPCENYCRIRINKVSLRFKGNKVKSVEYSTNAFQKNDGNLSFDVNDPFILIKNNENLTITALNIELEFVSIGLESANYSLEERKKEIRQTNEKLNQLTVNLTKLEKNLQITKLKQEELAKLKTEQGLIISEQKKALAERDNNIAQQKRIIQENESLIKQTELEAEVNSKLLSANQKLIFEFEQTIKKQEENLSELKNLKDQQKNKINEELKINHQLKNDLKASRALHEGLDKKLDTTITKYKQKIVQLESEFKKERQTIAFQNQLILEKEKELLSQKQNRILELNIKIKKHEEQLIKHKTLLEQDNVILENNRKILSRKDEVIQNLQSELISKSNELGSVERNLQETIGKLETQQRFLQSKEEEVSDSMIKINSLNRSLSFKLGWYTTAPARYVYYRIKKLRSNGKIWLWLKLLGQGSTNPFKTLKHINFKNIKTLFAALKSERPNTIFENFNKLISGDKTAAEPTNQSKIKYIKWRNNTPIDNPPVKVIAFYLPQFHAIPENDKWWGNGFTEWTNVKPAKPQFLGHYQPHIPGDLGYYNLSNPEVQQQQIAIAKNYGIGGFCFHFYWFNGKRLLEKPIENYLNNSNLDLPFCLSWANENWTRRWDGREDDILIKQSHSQQDDINFIKYISKYLTDLRYIRINGKPLVLVYRPELLPSPQKTAELWRKWCRKNGIGEIYLAYVQSFEKTNPDNHGYDAAIEFPPNNFYPPIISHEVTPLANDFNCNIYDWKNLVQASEHYTKPAYKLFRGVCPSWDNTARRKNHGTIFINNNAEDFKKWVYNAAIDTCKRFDNKDERLVFVNAWNEWAEGAYLEPNTKSGYANLQSIYDALKGPK